MLAPSQGSSNLLTKPPYPWRAEGKGLISQLTLSLSLISSSPPQPWTSSIGGRTVLAAPTLQSASAEPRTLRPWAGSRVWLEARATGRWSTARWSCSSTAARRLWSEPPSAPSYTAARVPRLLYQSLGAGRNRSRGGGFPSQPSDPGTRTPDQRTRKAMRSRSIGARGSGSRGGKAPRWGGVRSEGCSLDMLL